jgi:hypothetical protein
MLWRMMGSQVSTGAVWNGARSEKLCHRTALATNTSMRPHLATTASTAALIDSGLSRSYLTAIACIITAH